MGTSHFAEETLVDAQIQEAHSPPPLEQEEENNLLASNPPDGEPNPIETQSGSLLLHNKTQATDQDDSCVPLTEDIYSMMFTSEITSPAFSYVVFCFFFQYLFTALVIVDTLSNNERSKPLQSATGCAIASDHRSSLCWPFPCRMSYSPGRKCTTEGEQPGATTAKWYLAAVAQLLAGAGLNFVIFILVMQSSNIVGIFLNFAALMFISEIDDVGFKLADNGFINKQLQEACKDARRVKISMTQEANTIYRRVFFAAMAFALYVGYCVLTFRQFHGEFLCNRVFIQFGDDFGTVYAAFSGVNVQTGSGLVNQRVTNVEETRKGSSEAGRIGYRKAWSVPLASTQRRIVGL